MRTLNWGLVGILCEGGSPLGLSEEGFEIVLREDGDGPLRFEGSPLYLQDRVASLT
jgi:hypothetical protein